MGRDKATMAHPEHSGRTMVEHTVEVLRERCTPIIVVAAPGQPIPALGVEVLRDKMLGAGPLPATGLGLRAAAAAGAERAFVCAVDMPFLTATLVDQLAGYSGVDIVLPWDGRDHYLAGLYRTSLADRIEALVCSGARSMRALTDTASSHRVVLPPTRALANVNLPGDLRG